MLVIIFPVILIALIFSGTSCFAETEFGLGFSSPYVYRTVPVLSFGHETPNWKFTASTAGVQSQLYYQSTYGISAYKYWRAGELWGHEIQNGFGGGIYYSDRGFRDGISSPLVKATDVGIGPAFLVQWNFPAVFIRLESTLAAQNFLTTLFAVSVQDNTLFAIGFRW